MWSLNLKQKIMLLNGLKKNSKFDEKVVDGM